MLPDVYKSLSLSPEAPSSLIIGRVSTIPPMALALLGCALIIMSFAAALKQVTAVVATLFTANLNVNASEVQRELVGFEFDGLGFYSLEVVFLEYIARFLAQDRLRFSAIAVAVVNGLVADCVLRRVGFATNPLADLAGDFVRYKDFEGVDGIVGFVLVQRVPQGLRSRHGVDFVGNV
jgi:hypothetical protein